MRAGEAAKYGIYFDDREYDYTKHLKRIGTDPTAVFIPAAGAASEEPAASLADTGRHDWGMERRVNIPVRVREIKS